MRETRTCGSEGGEAQKKRGLSYPYWSSRTNRPGTGTGAAIIGEPNLLKGVIVPPLVKIYVEFPPW
jgi:hypothetical protein